MMKVCQGHLSNFVTKSDMRGTGDVDMPSVGPCLFLLAAWVRDLLDDHCGLVRHVAPIVVLPEIHLQQISSFINSTTGSK